MSGPGEEIAAAWAETQVAHDAPAPGPEAEVTRATGLGLDRGATVGRYLILGRLGEGGMGVVYTAHDPELDRAVALKVMRGGHGPKASSSDAPARLLREAQALARLAHPNVVAVHDVGAIGDEVWLAMEYVQGKTLGAWLKEQPRPWREVLAIFRQAGEGLAAAHQAGLVHRDFKPDNVLVGDDGRARVLDFGLARATERTPSLPPLGDGASEPGAARSGPRLLSSVGQRSELQSELTQDGAIVGTPAYMSPEQHLGLPVDARSDVFSFAVALWEALYGAHPFAAQTRAELIFAVTRGKVRPPARRGEAPRYVHRVLLRALSSNPGDRFADLRALLDALARGRRRRQRLLVAAALGALALVALVALLLRPAPVVAPPPCRGAEALLVGVWDDARREAVQKAILASGELSAATAWERARDHLDLYARAWAVMREDACEATQVRAEQSPELMDLRIACLDRHLRQVDALVDLLAEADQAVAARAVTAVAALPPLDRCADIHALQSPTPLPDDPRERRRIDALQGRLAGVKANLDAGRIADGIARASDLAADAQGVAYPPLHAEIALRRGQLLDRNGDVAPAEAALREAFFIATGARLDLVAAEAAIDLVYDLGVRQARGDAGLEWARHAQAAVRRLEPGPERDYLEAKRLDREGLVRTSMGDLAEGRVLQEQALARMRGAMGPDHLHTAAIRINLGATLSDLGDYPAALDHLQAAAAVFTRELGPDHLHLAAIHNNLGTLFDAQGDPRSAITHHRRALAIKERALGLQNPALAASHNNLGASLLDQGELSEAEHHLESALAIKAAAHGPASPHSVETLGLLADLHRRRGDPARGLAEAEGALRRGEAAFGADHPGHAALHCVAGEAAADLGRDADAIAHFERALAIADARGGEPRTRARAAQGLADRLWQRDPARAADLAAAALAFYGDRPGFADRRAALERSLAAHPRPAAARHE